MYTNPNYKPRLYYESSDDENVRIQPKPKPTPTQQQTGEYHGEQSVDTSREYIRKDGYSKSYKQEPIIVNQIVHANNQEEAIQIATDKTLNGIIVIDSYFRSIINGVETSSAFFIDDGTEPSGMYMRESTHLDYDDDDILECKDYDKKTGTCVLDNFIGVYSAHIKKLTRDKLIELCRE